MRYDNYCGNEHVALVTFGNTWADPLIEYKGFQWPAWMIEDALRDDFNAAGLPDTESHFVAYVGSHVEDYLQDCLFSLDRFDIHFIKKNAPGWFEQLREEIAYSDENDDFRGWCLISDSEVVEKNEGVLFCVEDFVSFV